MKRLEQLEKLIPKPISPVQRSILDKYGLQQHNGTIWVLSHRHMLDAEEISLLEHSNLEVHVIQLIYPDGQPVPESDFQ